MISARLDVSRGGKSDREMLAKVAIHPQKDPGAIVCAIAPCGVGDGGVCGSERQLANVPGRTGAIRFAIALYIDLTICSTIFLASEKSIMVLSRKNSSFPMPA